MRSKIIADIAVIAIGIIFVVWWFGNVPFPNPAPSDQTLSQALAIYVSVFSIAWIEISILRSIIKWLHKK